MMVKKIFVLLGIVACIHSDMLQATRKLNLRVGNKLSFATMDFSLPGIQSAQNNYIFLGDFSITHPLTKNEYKPVRLQKNTSISLKVTDQSFAIRFNKATSTPTISDSVLYTVAAGTAEICLEINEQIKPCQ